MRKEYDFKELKEYFNEPYIVQFWGVNDKDFQNFIAVGGEFFNDYENEKHLDETFKKYFPEDVEIRAIAIPARLFEEHLEEEEIKCKK